MKKIFKSKQKRIINIKKIIIMLLISFFVSYFLSNINFFKNRDYLNLLKKTSVNKTDLNDIKIKGEYLLNVALTSFDNITLSRKVMEETSIKNNELDPVIYIYNTHQTEEYRILETYNLTPTVHTAAYILKDMLKEYNIGVIVESSDLKTDLNSMGLTYNGAYTVSRNWLNKLNNNNLKLYIDLHRDSINYNLSNINIDGKDYAKIMFVLGNNHSNYLENTNTTEKLLNEVEKINKDISRGIFIRKGSVYNQDFNGNCILIELGGPDSTLESIINSLEVLSLAIKNYLEE